MKDAVAITTNAQLHSTKSKFWFCAGSNQASDMSEIRDGEDLTMVPTGNKAKCLPSDKHTTKTIHHHHQFIMSS